MTDEEFMAVTMLMMFTPLPSYIGIELRWEFRDDKAS